MQALLTKAKKTETKEKDLEKESFILIVLILKLMVKLNIATEKSNYAGETLRVHEEIARNAQEHYRKEVKPELHQVITIITFYNIKDLKNREKERCEFTKNVLQEFIQMERQVLERQLIVVDALCDRINAIDISEDVENFVVNCVMQKLIVFII